MKNFIVRESFLPAAGYFAEGSESEGAEKMSFSDLFHLFLSCPLNFGDSLHGANSLYVIVYICCAVLRELMPFKKLKKGPILKYALHIRINRNCAKRNIFMKFVPVSGVNGSFDENIG